MQGQDSFSPNDVLGVRADATAQEIKAKWKERAKVLHPDAGGDPVLFDVTLKAYEAALKNLENTTSSPSSPTNSGNSTPRSSSNASKANPKSESNYNFGGTSDSAFQDVLKKHQEEERIKKAKEAALKRRNKYPAETRGVHWQEVILTTLIMSALVALSIFARFSGLNRALFGIPLTQDLYGGQNLVDGDLPSVDIFPGGYKGIFWFSLAFGFFFALLWINRARRVYFPWPEKIIVGLVFFFLIFYVEYGNEVFLKTLLIVMKIYHSYFIRSKRKKKVPDLPVAGAPPVSN